MRRQGTALQQFMDVSHILPQCVCKEILSMWYKNTPVIYSMFWTGVSSPSIINCTDHQLSQKNCFTFCCNYTAPISFFLFILTQGPISRKFGSLTSTSLLLGQSISTLALDCLLLIQCHGTVTVYSHGYWSLAMHQYVAKGNTDREEEED